MDAIGKKIAVLACSNGLGHTRRVMAISSFILKNNYDVNFDMFVSNESLRCLSNWEEFQYLNNHKNVKFHHFIYPNCQSEKITNLIEKDWDIINLPDLSKYDLVWSDNILQVLEKRSEAIISGSFFWHEVLSKSNKIDGRINDFILKQKDILLNYKPYIVGNEYFSTPEVKNNLNFIPAGLYRYNINLSMKKERSVLFSCGLGGEELDISKLALKQIIDEKLKPCDYLYVEKRMLPKKYPLWIKVADFSDKMFNNCIAACIRPGLGTVSDALINNIRIFAFSKPNSFEMNYNGKIIQELGVGEYSFSPYESYKNALEYIKEDSLISLQKYKTIHMRTDGIFATAKFIINKL